MGWRQLPISTFSKASVNAHFGSTSHRSSLISFIRWFPWRKSRSSCCLLTSAWDHARYAWMESRQGFTVQKASTCTHRWNTITELLKGCGVCCRRMWHSTTGRWLMADGNLSNIIIYSLDNKIWLKRLKGRFLGKSGWHRTCWVDRGEDRLGFYAFSGHFYFEERCNWN